MSATTAGGRLGSFSRSFRAALNRTAGVQKTSKGAPAYSRYINRRLGRYLAAAAYALHMTPNQVTLVSATFSYGAIAAIALVEPTPLLAIAVAAALVLGYALDSADGQLARLQDAGGPAGEWLDHMVDCVKISALHLAVLISFYRFFSLDRESYLLLPLAFELIAVTLFFGTILTDQLRRANRRESSVPPAAEAAPVHRALLSLPTDYGLMCLIFLAFSVEKLFLSLYGLLLIGSAAYLLAASVKWYREIKRFSEATTADPSIR